MSCLTVILRLHFPVIIDINGCVLNIWQDSVLIETMIPINYIDVTELIDISWWNRDCVKKLLIEEIYDSEMIDKAISFLKAILF